MARQPFDPNAKTRQELIDSRSQQFIAIDARAAKGHYATPPVTREEHALVRQFLALLRQVDGGEPVETDQPW